VKALLLEDDGKLARFLERLLAEQGFDVDSSTRGVDAIAQAHHNSYDVVILDWMVPDTDGLAVCRELRRIGLTVPILMLTARGDLRERVRGLEAGADAYMVKPFEAEELVARLGGLVRRSAGLTTMRCGDIAIDRLTRRATAGGAPLLLTRREYELLSLLVRSAGRIVPRGDLLALLQGEQVARDSNLVDTHVSRLRERLGVRATMVETVRGVGYRLREP
jgi:DNA-binding response OmpR family regulator